jgi:type II secretory pathway component PulM
VSALAAWLAGRSARERLLLAGAGAIAAAVVALQLGLAVHDDFATLRARVHGHERELDAVRRAAAALVRSGPVGETTEAPLARLETVARAVVGRDRIAAMTPAAGPVEDGVAEERTALRIAGVTLVETTALLHGLETATPPLHVARLEMRKQPDDPTRFDVTVEVATLQNAS